MKNVFYLSIHNYYSYNNIFSLFKVSNISKNDFYQIVLKYIKDNYHTRKITEDDIIGCLSKFNHYIKLEKIENFNENISNLINSTYYSLLDIILSNERYILELKDYNNYKSYLRKIKRFYLNKTDGNCVDNFISKGVKPLLEDFNSYMINISLRKDERMKTNEYHNTDCYEKDFRQLIEMRDILKKIEKNFNKQIESISELYTKN